MACDMSASRGQGGHAVAGAGARSAGAGIVAAIPCRHRWARIVREECAIIGPRPIAPGPRTARPDTGDPDAGHHRLEPQSIPSLPCDHHQRHGICPCSQAQETMVDSPPRERPST